MSLIFCEFIVAVLHAPGYGPADDAFSDRTTFMETFVCKLRARAVPELRSGIVCPILRAFCIADPHDAVTVRHPILPFFLHFVYKIRKNYMFSPIYIHL